MSQGKGKVARVIAHVQDGYETIGGLPVPRHLSGSVDVKDKAFTYTVNAHIWLVGQRYRVKALHVEGDDITSEGLRKIPVQRITRGIVLDLFRHPLFRDPRLAVVDKPQAEIRRQGPTDENLGAVAAIYQLAHLVGDPPSKAVAEVLGLPVSTASRWIQMARKDGSLGPARQGRAG